MIDEDLPKVVLEQTLLNLDEVFVYRIPPLVSAGGYHAEDWNLANPQATCALHVLRRDSTLLIQLHTFKPKPDGPPGSTELHLFAQSKIDLLMESSISSSSKQPTTATTNNTKKTMEHWIEPVVDSSRYFVLRIQDDTSGREARVGIGFRERNDAVNFRMAVQDYENCMRKEQLVEKMHMHSDQQQQQQQDSNFPDVVSSSTTESGEQSDYDSNSLPQVSKLSLKDGETIHINIPNSSSSASMRVKQHKHHHHDTTEHISSPSSKPPLLRKPPPPATTSSCDKAIVVNTELFIKKSPSSHHSTSHHFDASSIAAVAESMDMDDEDWGDFESSNNANHPNTDIITP